MCRTGRVGALIGTSETASARQIEGVAGDAALGVDSG